MALKKYCSSCGQPTEYTTLVPKLCSQCGFNFSQAFSSVKREESKKITPKKQVIARDTEEDDEEDNNEEIKDFSGVEFEVEFEGGNGLDRTSIGNIINTPRDKDFRARPADKSLPKNKKQLAEWLQNQNKVNRIIVGGDGND